MPTPRLLQKLPKSLENTLLVTFAFLAGVIIILFIFFVFLNQQRLNRFLLDRVNDSTVLLDKTVSLYRQQLINEFNSVSQEVLAAHQEIGQEVIKADAIDGLWLKEHKKKISASIKQTVEINLISDQCEIFQSSYALEKGVDLS